MKPKMTKFKVGDRVQIIDIHRTDGFVLFKENTNLLNRTGTIVERKMESDNPDIIHYKDGYVGCRVLLDIPTRGFTSPLFYKVKLKKLEDENQL